MCASTEMLSSLDLVEDGEVLLATFSLPWVMVLSETTSSVCWQAKISGWVLQSHWTYLSSEIIVFSKKYCIHYRTSFQITAIPLLCSHHKIPVWEEYCHCGVQKVCDVNRIIKWQSLIIAWQTRWTRYVYMDYPSQIQFWLLSSEFWSSFVSSLEDCSLLPDDNWLIEEQLSLNREWLVTKTAFEFKG